MSLEKLVAGIKTKEHGFTHVIAAGEKILADESLNHFALAKIFFSDGSYQVRMLATYLLGEIWSGGNTKALTFLKTRVANDENWRVQEMLAKAVDRSCKINGYEQSLPLLKKLLAEKNANLKRAVVEGLRIWTSRPYFKDNPELAVKLISSHRSDESEYLRQSVGNALRDISKKHPALIKKETSGWDLNDSRTAFVLHLVNGSK